MSDVPVTSLPWEEGPAPLCLECDYNLTGLSSGRCPECGWAIDWELARADEESRRRGSPVHQADAAYLVPATAATVLLMLFRPIRFARRLRADESWLPAALVAVAALVMAFGPPLVLQWHRTGDWFESVLLYSTSISACILFNAVFFVVLSRGGPNRLTCRRRFRLFLLLSLYSSVFIAAWGLFDGPPIFEGWDGQSNFFFPFDAPLLSRLSKLTTNPAYLGRTVIYYWWIGIILSFAAVRMRPRWAALLYLPVPVLASYTAVLAAMTTWRVLH